MPQIDHAQHIAHHVVSLAIDDEIGHRGAAQISDSLAVFVEHRVAEAIRRFLPPESRRIDYDA